jgi:hypothetical protein
MIDTDKYEGTNWDLRGQFTHTEELNKRIEELEFTCNTILEMNE